MEVNFCQELLISDSNAWSIGMTKAEKLLRLKGLREGCDSNDLWKSFFGGRRKVIEEKRESPGAEPAPGGTQRRFTD
jgi:hypothetical protein